MRDSYNKLGMDDKAADIQRILDANKNRGSYDTYLRQELEAAQELPLLRKRRCIK